MMQQGAVIWLHMLLVLFLNLWGLGAGPLPGSRAPISEDSITKCWNEYANHLILHFSVPHLFQVCFPQFWHSWARDLGPCPTNLICLIFPVTPFSFRCSHSRKTVFFHLSIRIMFARCTATMAWALLPQACCCDNYRVNHNWFVDFSRGPILETIIIGPLIERILAYFNVYVPCV